jgi:multidrug efflux system outer membrane protein
MKSLHLSLLALATASCAVGPDYERPAVNAPAAYRSATAGDSATPSMDRRWWTLFGDPRLVDLEEEAARANPDLRAAIARVTEARAAARVTDSAFFPSLSANPSASRSRSSANGPRGTGQTSNDFVLPLDFGYELDVWGKVRRSSEASHAQLQASEDDSEVVLQSIQGEVARNYFTLRSLDSQADILRRTVDVYRQQLSLLETQFQVGLVGRITVVQQESQLYSTMTQEVEVRRARANVEHALAILLGRPPSEYSLASSPLDLAPPKVPVGLPSQLLRRRPDVAGAERLLAAASAQIGVAVAQFYPDLRITGGVGLESADLRHLFEWQSRIWTLAAGAVLPLFEGGQLEAGVDLARARYEESLANYHGRVLSAFRDVEDALTDLHLRADAADAQSKAVASSREYVTLSETQFRQGLVGYLQVTDAQRTLLVNELAAAQLLNERLVSTVQLIKALGAGWEETP